MTADTPIKHDPSYKIYIHGHTKYSLPNWGGCGAWQEKTRGDSIEIEYFMSNNKYSRIPLESPFIILMGPQHATGGVSLNCNWGDGPPTTRTTMTCKLPNELYKDHRLNSVLTFNLTVRPQLKTSSWMATSAEVTEININVL